jgi:hypothetical protein
VKAHAAASKERPRRKNITANPVDSTAQVPEADRLKAMVDARVTELMKVSQRDDGVPKSSQHPLNSGKQSSSTAANGPNESSKEVETLQAEKAGILRDLKKR